MEFAAFTPGKVGVGVGAVSLAGTATPTARTVLLLINADAGISFVIKEIGVFFDGVTATNSPVLVELVKCDMSTAGTPGKPATATQWRGPGNSAGAGITDKITANAAYTVEPTVITVVQPYLVPPTTGLVVPLPLGDEPEVIPGSNTMALGLRVTPPNAVDVTAYMRFMQGVT